MGLLAVEGFFNEKIAADWMNILAPYSVHISVLYLVLIYWGKQYMASRKPFNLRRLLFTWSVMLAGFSLIGTISLGSYVISSWYNYGFTYTVCDRSSWKGSGGLWAFLFGLSKLPELGDTFFIVVRKTPLQFLHYYHHITVFIYCWYSLRDLIAPGRWFAAINFLVHTVMYSYYAIKSTGQYRPPKWINMAITTLQLSQMVVGCIVNTWAYSVLKSGQRCGTTWSNLKWSLIMYSSYFLLFAHFFYQTYFVNSSRWKSSQQSKGQNSNNKSVAAK